MKTTLILAILLAGCTDAQQPGAEWKCIGGLTYQKVNGAWVQIDGHPLINFRDGPIKCADDSAAQRDAK